MFAKDFAIVVPVTDEVGLLIADSEFNDILDGRRFGEQGLNVWRKIVPCPMCRRIEEICLLRTHYKGCEDWHVDCSRCLPSAVVDEAEIWQTSVVAIGSQWSKSLSFEST